MSVGNLPGLPAGMAYGGAEDVLLSWGQGHSNEMGRGGHGVMVCVIHRRYGWG